MLLAFATLANGYVENGTTKAKYRKTGSIML
jgi:hypothetical protein